MSNGAVWVCYFGSPAGLESLIGGCHTFRALGSGG
jgi:hypothetical protein